MRRLGLGRLALSTSLLLCLVLAAAPVWAGYGELNLPKGVTPLSKDVYELHMIILWICVVIGVVVFGVMFWAMYYHRKSRGATASQFHHSTFAEIVWTIIPFVILVVMAIPATKTLIAMENTGDADITIKVTGYQWKWRYEYIHDDISFFSNLAFESREQIYNDPSKNKNYLLDVDKALVLPANKKVRFLLTSDDVIHAWWVPALGMKKDAIPGFINEMWAKIETPGIYRGQCTELCGKDHGFMPVVVQALPQAEYEKWLVDQKAQATAEKERATQEWAVSELLAKGEKVYATNCATCHQQDGRGIAGVFPKITDSPIATGPMDAHLNLVLQGKPGTPMRAFSSHLSDTELAAVVTYQRNALGNATGDHLQPATVRAARL